MYKDFKKDMTRSQNIKLDERILQYCLSNDGPNLWLDLCATNNGATERYICFFLEVKKIIEK